MKILLDECIPRKFKNSFPEHDRRTVADEGLSGRKNGELLRLAEVSGFSVFISVDRGLEYEQNLADKNDSSHSYSRYIQPSSRFVTPRSGNPASAGSRS
jgi:hypothetical protein